MKEYRAGTLVYTRAGIITLFTWLLWGDFCYSFMEVVWPSVLPLTLKSLGTSNTLLSIVVTTVPSIMNFVLNPIISTASDRYRGPRGRRIPFLLFATPFVSLLLIVLGFSRHLGHWLAGVLGSQSPATVTIALICVLIVVFRFFELFVGTVYWYLFNDVVPPPLMGRFLGLFRVIGALAGGLFNFFILRYAETHASWIFWGAGILYGTVFTIMCLKVKEGEYPPPEPLPRGKPPFLAHISTFFATSLERRLYRLVFLASGLLSFAGSINPFTIFFVRSLGLTLEDFGWITGTAGIVAVALVYPMGALVDRYHPMRIALLAQIGLTLAMPINLIFLFFSFQASQAFWIYALFSGLSLPFLVAYGAANLPLMMRIFPRERFGQFCAANAMCVSAGIVVGGLLTGFYLDLIKGILGSTDESYYRFVPVWQVTFQCLALVAFFAVFREWKKSAATQESTPTEA